VALKDLGFSLEEIGHLLEEDLSTEQMRGMLKLRQAEIRQRVEEEARRLERVERWLRQIGQEDSVSKYDVVIKKVEPVRVAARKALETMRSLGYPMMDVAAPFRDPNAGITNIEAD
jgi:DNA-binding transcriptional MerR regulator